MNKIDISKYLNTGNMKRLLLFTLSLMPLFSLAQANDSFLENTTIIVEKTQINSATSDFGPAFVDGGLWFSTYTLQENQKSKKNKSTLYYELYETPVDAKGNLLSTEKELTLEEERAGYNAGPVSYCEATNELFVTVNNYQDPDIENIVFQKANIPLKIIILKKSENNWINAGEVPFNNSTYSVAHPAISVTGDTLIFVSDIPEKGKGGTDLYMSVRENGKWGEMINLGDKINTDGNEMFPYFHKGKYLFFASNGKTDSTGGLDIYYAEQSANGFNQPVNMKELNSAADDFGLVVHQDEETGYFVSQREGGQGDDDIYKVLFEGQFDLELLVLDKHTEEPIPNVKVDFSDGKTAFTNSEGTINRELEKATDYTATTDVTEYMNGSVSFSTKNMHFGSLKAVIYLEKVEVGQKFVLENIYYDFDKSDILPESEVELNKLVKVLEDNPKWKIELGSHTDSRGSSTYNEKLSQRRSESAVGYIISQGISESRIIARGYGETQLVNECADGVQCTEEQHRQNRRTEFTILELE
ncbi:WD40-like Beta Propeller Repeat [Mariniphaga anaerophila]|uniref:WD40-like Beta Propeller Repeat n=1 Tax=Mariniphaga anaerophila TaxID=1484053 RepID=A0A1M4ZNA8_9BACT|nr:OmpA family protein [Mariniphaga anaerophila]SHF19523.1 WD40-like Beta Propeller Repeat [Mariniphaga anaerophila]